MDMPATTKWHPLFSLVAIHSLDVSPSAAATESQSRHISGRLIERLLEIDRCRNLERQRDFSCWPIFCADADRLQVSATRPTTNVPCGDALREASTSAAWPLMRKGRASNRFRQPQRDKKGQARSFRGNRWLDFQPMMKLALQWSRCDDRSGDRTLLTRVTSRTRH